MVIIGTVVVLAALLGIGWSGVVLIKRLWGLTVATSPSRTTPSRTIARPDLPPYGALPGLGPVGPLGELAPDADLDATGSDPSALYGN